MSRKIHILFSLCLLFLPAISVAQDDFSIFAKQKVVVYEIADRNDRPLSEGLKKVIHQSIVDVCTNSEDYEVYEVNIAEIKRLLTASGKTPNPANICQEIGQKADFIIFTTVKASQSVIQSSSKMIAELLGLSETKQGQQRATTTTTTTATTPSTTPSTTQVEPAQELYAKGNNYFDKNNYISAVLYFRKAAEQGNTRAQYWLGYCYFYGYGVTKDATEAVRWYRKAAEQGHPGAQYILNNEFGYNY